VVGAALIRGPVPNQPASVQLRAKREDLTLLSLVRGHKWVFGFELGNLRLGFRNFVYFLSVRVEAMLCGTGSCLTMWFR